MSDRPKRLYHGTRADISPWEGVRPGRSVGYSTHGTTGAEYGQASHDYAFATPSEEHAWRYADNADGSGRTRIYEVHANPYMKRGAFHDINQEWRADFFPIRRSIDIRPGRQGTLPLNWSQFHTPELAARGIAPDDLDHPSPAAVAYGHSEARRAGTTRLGDLPDTRVTHWSSFFAHQDDELPGMPARSSR